MAKANTSRRLCLFPNLLNLVGSNKMPLALAVVMDCLFAWVWFIIYNWTIIEYRSSNNKVMCQTLCESAVAAKCQFWRERERKKTIKKTFFKHFLFFISCKGKHTLQLLYIKVIMLFRERCLLVHKHTAVPEDLLIAWCVGSSFFASSWQSTA